MSKQQRRFCVILAGGEGSRLWPLSQPDLPKPFLKLFDGASMLALTHQRLLRLGGEVYISVTDSLEAQVKKELPSLSDRQILAEPAGRNTAACILLAVIRLSEKDPDAVLGFFPADHILLNEAHWIESMEQAFIEAETYDEIVLVGTQPQGPATGYGYITAAQSGSRQGLRFLEKPTREKASELIDQGALWNCGVFIGRARSFLAAFEKHLPQETEALRKSLASGASGASGSLVEVYPTLPSISFDYAISQKLDRFRVISTKIRRIDVGNFDSFHAIWPQDERQNAVFGEFHGIESSNNVVFSQGKPVLTLGIENLVILNAPEAVVVFPRSRAQDVKTLRGGLSQERKSSPWPL